MKDKEVILFRNRKDNTFVGFIIIHQLVAVISGKETFVIQGDFFALRKEYRSQPKPLLSLLYFCVIQKFKLWAKLDFFTPIYYFFTTYSYKSYLSFARAMGQYWPRHSAQTPTFEHKLLDYLGQRAASLPSLWGEYDSKTCVIRDLFSGQRGNLKESQSTVPIAQIERQLLRNTVDYFMETNPNSAMGDCLCVCAPVTVMNFLSGVWKTVTRLLGVNHKGVTRPNASVSPHQTRQEALNVAFGLFPRAAPFTNNNVEMDRVHSFSVNVPEDDIRALKQKLHDVRFPDEIENEDWGYGTNLTYMKELVRYWRDEFDWRAQEAVLNKFHQEVMIIDDAYLHYVKVRSSNPNAFPVILLHGWPSTFFEFYKVIDRLTEPQKHGRHGSEAYDVIVPSLPGYGFSTLPRKKGFDIKQLASILVKLMEKIGVPYYGVAGGDWGGLAASYMAILDPIRCRAVHLNMPLTNFEPSNLLVQAGMFLDYTFRSYLFTKEENEGIDDLDLFEKTESGYSALQTTKPQTLAYSLSDSPVGLAAWMVEKFRTWSDCKGDIESVWSKDEILTHVCIYWFSNSMNSACRLYYETKKTERFGCPDSVIEIPVGVSIFPKELIRVPRRWAAKIYSRIISWNYLKQGGHFPAHEQAEEYTTEICNFFQKIIAKGQLNVK